jgi:hypothetical protein
MDVPAPAASSADFERSEHLLRAAGLLLSRSEQLNAARALHAEALRAGGGPEQVLQPSPYATLREAEDEHRQLRAVLARERRQAGRVLGWRRVWTRWPQWLAWAVVILVSAGVSVGYAAGLVDRALWTREHPDGAWISRYYKRPRLKGTPFVRHDTAIDYDWGRKAPVGGMPRNRWSARWDTCLHLKQDALLDLRLIANRSARLLVDGKARLDVRSPGQKKRSLSLPAGVHHLRVNYEKLRGPAVVKLEGIEFAGTEVYSFQRPTFENGEVRCEGQAAEAAAPVEPAPPAAAPEAAADGGN